MSKGNPCGTARVTILEESEVRGIPVYLGSGKSPVNSPAQYFVAWGAGIISEGNIPTFNFESEESGHLWFVDEDEAEAKYEELSNG